MHLNNRQLSGRLLAALPIGLHQLSLEENPWICDCRLLTLKRWLLSSRTPLRAPVRCHSMGLSEWRIRQRNQQPSYAHQQVIATRDTPTKLQFLHQLALDEFVCPPQGRAAKLSGHESAMAKPPSAASQILDVATVYEYLWPTLIRAPLNRTEDLLGGQEVATKNDSDTPSQQQKPDQHKESLQAAQGKCPSLIFPFSLSKNL